jgi:hypothetical protein
MEKEVLDFRNYLFRLKSDDDRKEAIAVALAEVCIWCGEITHGKICPCQNDE